MAVQAHDAGAEVLLLVVHGDDDIEHGDIGGGGRVTGRKVLPDRQAGAVPAVPAAAAGRTGAAPEAVGCHAPTFANRAVTPVC
ncbi:hypothetical protein GCM10010342_22040 [Streptomyces anulatus]|nr:hypothetical protein GCM10010342_22040 [Streptomyces anulatus]